MKKLLSILLLASLLLSACGETKSGGETSGESTSDTVESTSAEETEELSDDLPEKDFGGYDFTMFIRNDDGFIRNMYVEEADSDIMNDAIFERNSRVAERFNVNFSLKRANDTSGGHVKTVIMANEDVYDIIVIHARKVSMLAHNGLLLDWNTELPYVDLDKPWWNQDCRNSLSIANKLYTCVGDISYLDLGAADAMLFNRKLFDDYGISDADIYDTVKKGNWTFDRFAEIARNSYLDLNSDGIMDIDNDQYGYVTYEWIGPIEVLYTGSQRICTKDENDELVLSLNTERTVNIFNKFFALTDSDAGLICSVDEYEKSFKVFSDNRAVFTDMNIKDIEKLRNMSADFGIIPWPKFDETETKYYSNVDAGCNLIGVPITAGDPERTSIILEALCADGSKNVIPKYYETVLQTKYTRDDDSVQMLDYIRDGRVFDPGYFYSNEDFNNPINSVGNQLIAANGHNFATFYAKNEAAAKKLIEGINKTYRDR